MKNLLVPWLLLLFGVSLNSGHYIRDARYGNSNGYQIRKRSGVDLENLKPDKPTLRDILYNHNFEQPGEEPDTTPESKPLTDADVKEAYKTRSYLFDQMRQRYAVKRMVEPDSLHRRKRQAEMQIPDAPRLSNRDAYVLPKTYGMNLNPEGGYVWNNLNKPSSYYELGPSNGNSNEGASTQSQENMQPPSVTTYIPPEPSNSGSSEDTYVNSNRPGATPLETEPENANPEAVNINPELSNNPEGDSGANYPVVPILGNDEAGSNEGFANNPIGPEVYEKPELSNPIEPIVENPAPIENANTQESGVPQLETAISQGPLEGVGESNEKPGYVYGQSELGEPTPEKSTEKSPDGEKIKEIPEAPTLPPLNYDNLPDFIRDAISSTEKPVNPESDSGVNYPVEPILGNDEVRSNEDFANNPIGPEVYDKPEPSDPIKPIVENPAPIENVNTQESEIPQSEIPISGASVTVGESNEKPGYLYGQSELEELKPEKSTEETPEGEKIKEIPEAPKLPPLNYDNLPDYIRDVISSTVKPGQSTSVQSQENIPQSSETTYTRPETSNSGNKNPESDSGANYPVEPIFGNGEVESNEGLANNPTGSEVYGNPEPSYPVEPIVENPGSIENANTQHSEIPQAETPTIEGSVGESNNNPGYGQSELEDPKPDRSPEEMPETPMPPSVNYDNLPDYIKDAISSTEKPTSYEKTDNPYINPQTSPDDKKVMEDKMESIFATIQPIVDIPKTYGMNLTSDGGHVWNDMVNPPVSYDIGSPSNFKEEHKEDQTQAPITEQPEIHKEPENPIPKPTEPEKEKPIVNPEEPNQEPETHESEETNNPILEPVLPQGPGKEGEPKEPTSDPKPELPESENKPEPKNPENEDKPIEQPAQPIQPLEPISDLKPEFPEPENKPEPQNPENEDKLIEQPAQPIQPLEPISDLKPEFPEPENKPEPQNPENEDKLIEQPAQPIQPLEPISDLKPELPEPENKPEPQNPENENKPIEQPAQPIEPLEPISNPKPELPEPENKPEPQNSENEDNHIERPAQPIEPLEPDISDPKPELPETEKQPGPLNPENDDKPIEQPAQPIEPLEPVSDPKPELPKPEKEPEPQKPENKDKPIQEPESTVKPENPEVIPGPGIEETGQPCDAKEPSENNRDHIKEPEKPVEHICSGIPEEGNKPDIMNELLKSEQFWKWLGEWTATYMELLEKHMRKIAIQEICRREKAGDQMCPLEDEIDGNENPKDAGVIIKDGKIVVDGKEIDITQTNNLDSEVKGHHNKKPENKDSNGNKVEASTIYGNSVGNEKVTNIFIFTADKTEEVTDKLKPDSEVGLVIDERIKEENKGEPNKEISTKDEISVEDSSIDDANKESNEGAINKEEQNKESTEDEAIAEVIKVESKEEEVNKESNISELDNEELNNEEQNKESNEDKKELNKNENSDSKPEIDEEDLNKDEVPKGTSGDIEEEVNDESKLDSGEKNTSNSEEYLENK